MGTLKKVRMCVARIGLLYGSRECDKPAEGASDLCKEHAKKIEPNQLLNGVLYVDLREE